MKEELSNGKPLIDYKPKNIVVNKIIFTNENDAKTKYDTLENKISKVLCHDKKIIDKEGLDEEVKECLKYSSKHIQYSDGYYQFQR